MIKALWEVSGLVGDRIPTLTGVWIDGAKVAAIGIRATKWITYHGVAVNISMNLEPYKYIIPCGIANKAVTSIDKVLSNGNQRGTIDTELMMEYRVALIQAFEEVFEASVINQSKPPSLSNVK